MYRTNIGRRKYLFDLVVIGGLGHLGLPLGLAFAHKGLKVCLCDLDSKKAGLLKKGKMPFIEYGTEKILRNVLKKKNLKISLEMNSVSKAKYVIIAIGTPVDEYLNPRINNFIKIISRIKKYLHKDQAIIVCSTVYPGTCKQILKVLGEDEEWSIAYCPERTVQGYAIKELSELPNIVAGMTDKALEEACDLFSVISRKIIKTSIEEAELIKLFSNAWRYIKFAVTNQFYMIAENLGVDYKRVRKFMVEEYGRAITLPSAGFAAGPCLLKDTMQLAAFNNNNFFLGHAAMMINEGLPNFIVEKLRRKYDLSKIRVGILGMTFKADIDDIRESLSYKLGKILKFYGAKVLYSDEFVKDSTFIPKEKLIENSDVVIIAVLHSVYKRLRIPNKIEVINLWDHNFKTETE